MPSDEFPNGTVLRRANPFSGADRHYEVVAGGDKGLKLVVLDGPLSGDRVSVTLPQAREAYEVVRCG